MSKTTKKAQTKPAAKSKAAGKTKSVKPQRQVAAKPAKKKTGQKSQRKNVSQKVPNGRTLQTRDEFFEGQGKYRKATRKEKLTKDEELRRKVVTTRREEKDTLNKRIKSSGAAEGPKQKQIDSSAGKQTKKPCNPDGQKNKDTEKEKFPHFRKYKKSNHPALIVGEQKGKKTDNQGKEYETDEYKYRKVMHNEKDGNSPNEKVFPNPNPKDPQPMYIGKRVRHDEKKYFEKKYPWKYPPEQKK